MAAKGICTKPCSVEGKDYKAGEVFEVDASELQRLCVQHPESFSTYNPEVHAKAGETGGKADATEKADDKTGKPPAQ